MTDMLNNRGASRGASLEDQKTADEKIFEQQHFEDEQDAEARADRDLVEGFPDKEKRKLLRKMDLHIIPILISLYCMLVEISGTAHCC